MKIWERERERERERGGVTQHRTTARSGTLVAAGRTGPGGARSARCAAGRPGRHFFILISGAAWRPDAGPQAAPATSSRRLYVDVA